MRRTTGFTAGLLCVALASGCLAPPDPPSQDITWHAGYTWTYEGNLGEHVQSTVTSTRIFHGGGFPAYLLTVQGDRDRRHLAALGQNALARFGTWVDPLNLEVRRTCHPACVSADNIVYPNEFGTHPGGLVPNNRYGESKIIQAESYHHISYYNWPIGNGLATADGSVVVENNHWLETPFLGSVEAVPFHYKFKISHSEPGTIHPILDQTEPTFEVRGEWGLAARNFVYLEAIGGTSGDQVFSVGFPTFWDGSNPASTG